MAKIVNVVASCSNTGKTVLIEGLIKELKNRGYTVATIKHDVHGFDIDKEGKDTWRHRKAGAEAVIISSRERMALIREVKVIKKANIESLKYIDKVLVRK